MKTISGGAKCAVPHWIKYCNKIILISDVDTDEPDEKSILLYISHLYKACPSLPNHPFQKQHDQVCDRLKNILFYFCFVY